MGCPIGASWRVRHLDGAVHIDLAVRASEIGADEAIAELATPFIIERSVYADQIHEFVG